MARAVFRQLSEGEARAHPKFGFGGWLNLLLGLTLGGAYLCSAATGTAGVDDGGLAAAFGGVLWFGLVFALGILQHRAFPALARLTVWIAAAAASASVLVLAADGRLRLVDWPWLAAQAPEAVATFDALHGPAAAAVALILSLAALASHYLTRSRRVTVTYLHGLMVA